MLHRKRRQILKGIAAGTTAGLAGCFGDDGRDGGDSDNDDGSGGMSAEFRIVTPGYDDMMSGTVIPLFEAQSDSTVETQDTPADATSTRDYYVNQFIAQSSDFDIGMMDVIWPAEFAENGWAQSLGDPGRFEDAMLQTPLEAATIDGDLVGVPMFTDANALYYREDKLEEYGYDGPPKTYMKLVEIAQDVLEQDDEIQNGYIWQGGANEGLTIMWLNWLWGMGGTVRHDGDIVVNTDTGVEALQHAVDLIYEHEVTPKSVPASSTDQNRQTFQQGGTLFMRNWPYAVALMNADDSPISGQFDVTQMPTHEDYPDANNSCLGGWSVFVNAYTEESDAATEFAEFVASEEVQRAIAIENSRLPVREDIYEDEEVREEFPLIELFADILPRTNARPATAEYPTLSEIIFTECNNALVQEKSPQEALDDAQEQIENNVN